MTVFEFFKNFKETPLKKKLRLPKRFVRLYGETLSNEEVFLKPTRGLEVWKIGLIKSEGKVWLKQGWPAFAKRYALGEGRLVFFGYEGNSEFTFSICDNRKSATQIYCSPNPASSEETEVNGNAKVPSVPGTDYDNAIEITDSLSLPWTDEEVESPPPCSSTHKRMRTRSSGRCEKRMANSTSDEDSVGSNSEIEGKRGNQGLGRGKKSKVLKGRQSPTPNEKGNSLSSDGGHKSSNPSFVVVMKPSHVGASASVTFPIEFWREHLNGRDGKVVLYGSDGAAWTVYIYIKTFKAFVRPIFRRGWKNFVQYNDLVVGDICTFELINRSKISFKVTFSRIVDDSNSEPSTGKFRNLNSEEDHAARPGCFHLPYCPFVHRRACEAAGKFSSRFPFFKVILKKTTYYQRVPISFALKHFEQNKQIIQIEVGKRSWPVGLVKASTGYYLRRGFNKFLSQNSLRPRDVCIFELIKEDPVTLEATIFKYDMV